MATKKTQPYSLSFEADFSTMVREAQRVSGKLEDIFKEATKKGFKNVNLRGIKDQVEKLQVEEYKHRQQLEFRLERKRAEAENRLNDARKEAWEKIEEINERIAKEDNKAVKKRLEAEREVEELRSKIFDEGEEFNEETLKTTVALRKTVATLMGAEKSAKRSAGYYNRTAERVGKISKLFSDDLDAGADSFIDKLSEGLDGLAGKLTSSVDLGALVKGGSGAASKGLRAVGDAVGNLGKVGPVLASTAGALAGVVAAFGIFAAVMFDMDRKVKEFNKSAVNTYGALSLNRLGSKDLNKGLRILNHTVTDLTANLGVTQDEAMTLFDVLDKGGFTLDRISRRSGDAIMAQKNLGDGLRVISTTARMTGVSIGDYASQLTDYVNDLGMSLNTVNDSFANIANMAAKASFGTRRFYGMVVQATSGQSSLNVRLDQTAELLMKMTKILGQKKAAEMVANHGTDLSGLSATERIRMGILSGKRGTRIMGREASSQATNFAVRARNFGPALGSALQQAGVDPSVGQAITNAGRAGAGTDAAATASTSGVMVQALRKMSSAQQSSLIAALQSNPATVDLGRQMSQLIDVTRASSGSLGDFVNGLQGASAGGSIALRLSELNSVGLGRLEDIRSPEGRAAAENVTGLSGAQYDMMREVSRVVAGQFRNLQGSRPTDEAGRRRQIEAYGATTDESGVLRAATIGANGQIQYLEQIQEANDLMSGYMSRADINLDEIRTEQAALMSETFDATVSVADILENKILFYIRALYENVGMPMMGYVSELLERFNVGGAADRKAAKQATEAITAKLQEEATNQSLNQRKLARVNTDLQSATGTKREDLMAQKRALEGQIAARGQRTDALRAAQGRINSGNTWDTREGRGKVELDNLLRWGGQAQVSGATAWQNTMGAAPMPGAMATPGAAAPTPTPTPAPTAAPPTVATTETQTEAVTTAVGAAATATAANATTNAEEGQKQAEQRAQRGQQHMTRLLTRETKLGDALARSKLPDAIVEAQLRQDVMALGTAAGLVPEKATEAANQFLQQGTLSNDLRTALTAHSELAGAAMHVGIGTGNPAATRFRMAQEADENQGVEDFIYRGNGVQGSITPIDTQDQFFGARPGGAIDRAVNGGGGRGPISISIQINGGDERKVYDMVKKVLRDSGITPTRMGSNA